MIASSFKYTTENTRITSLFSSVSGLIEQVFVIACTIISDYVIQGYFEI